MSIPYLLAAVLAVTLASLLVLRAQTTRIKLGGEVLLLGLVGGCLVAMGTTPLPGHAVLTTDPDADWLRALAVIWWLIGARLVAVLTVLALGRDARSKEARIVSDLLAGAIYLTAILIILNSVLGLRVNGLIATSGVIAIVLGLALQNTLADVFSGVAVGVEQPFHLGDRVSVGEHSEGVVVQINWRAIRVQTDTYDVATIPNSIVARSEIINRSVPTTRRASSVDIPTLSKLKTEVLTGLIRQAVLLCPAVLDRPPPSVLIKSLGTRTTMLSVSFHAATTTDLATAKGQLLRQVRRLFRHADVLQEHQETPASLLAGLALFEELKVEQVAQLVEGLISHRYDVGGTVFHQGASGASLFVVRSGILEVTHEDAAKNHSVYGRIGPGEYIGEVSMMSGDPHPVTATAKSKAEVLELPRSSIQALVSDDASLSAALERSIQRGLALLDRDAAARTCEPLDENGSLLGRIRAFLARRAV